jgi:hypothetical protein
MTRSFTPIFVVTLALILGSGLSYAADNNRPVIAKPPVVEQITNADGFPSELLDLLSTEKNVSENPGELIEPAKDISVERIQMSKAIESEFIILSDSNDQYVY